MLRTSITLLLAGAIAGVPLGLTLTGTDAPTPVVASLQSRIDAAHHIAPFPADGGVSSHTQAPRRPVRTIQVQPDTPRSRPTTLCPLGYRAEGLECVWEGGR